VKARPISPPALVDELVARLVVRPGRVRALVDGAPPSGPYRLAEALIEPLRVAGRPALHVAAGDFLRPASVRLERGRNDADELLDGWLDVGGLIREVLGPAASDGSGRVLPRLWNAEVDRAYRDERVTLPDNAVVVVSGSLLLGLGLPGELTVHLRMSAAALARRTPDELGWTLPAYERYAAERNPGAADVLVLADDPEHPALVEADGGP
jgi:hypothetical protein